MTNVIGFDPAAYSVDGARISSDLIRVANYIDADGGEGIVSPGDCKVHQLPAAAGQIAIDPGALVIKNRSAGVRNQAYIANGRTETRLDIDPTGSSGKRSDLICVRVEDPQFAPWTTPSAAAAPGYQYVVPFVQKNVPDTTTTFAQLGLGYSAYALGRIDIPANTTAITDQMIVSLRELLNPRSQRVMYSGVPVAEPLNVTAAFAVWPNLPFALKAPAWATHLDLRADIVGLAKEAAAADAEFQLRAGATLVSASSYLDNNASSDNSRHNTLLMLSGAIPTAERGTTLATRVTARRYAADTRTGKYFTDASVVVGYDAQFSEKAV